jgi:DNA polymerase I-like protein with 3'-5' exonuclease and polymerase domains
MFPDYVKLEMQMAKLMNQQETSGFRFDVQAAERVRSELAAEAQELEEKIKAVYLYVPDKVFTPKRNDAKKGYISGAPLTKLNTFNPTSRQNIAWALTTFRGARFTKLTDLGKPKVDEATLSEVRDIALSQGNRQLFEECEWFIRLLTLQKWMGQLSEGSNSWFNTIEEDGCIHHTCSLATQTGRNAHRGPNLGQVVSAPWARQLFVPHVGHKMVGCDLEGLELRCLGGYLARFDDGNFAAVVLDGDIHQQNADRIGVTRTQAKTLSYAFIYGSGDAKLGHILSPELSDAQKKSVGAEIRRKFLDAIPGLEPLIDAVKTKVRAEGRIRGLDGRPIFCTTEYCSLNYLLQSAGAILSKRWVVISQQLIDAAGLTYDKDYTRCAYVHDEQQFSVIPSEAEHLASLLVEAAPKAGQYYNFKVPIAAASEIGDTWADTH